MFAEELLICLSAHLFRFTAGLIICPLRKHFLRFRNRLILTNRGLTPGLRGSRRTRSFFLKLTGIGPGIKAFLLHRILL